MVLLVLAVVALGGLGFLFYNASSQKAALQRQVEEARMAQEKAAAQHELAQTKAEINMARMRQDDLLNNARNATNQLSQLIALITDVNNRANALQTSDTGRKAAQHPDLVARARRLYESDLPNLTPIAVITAKLESVRRIEQQTVKELGTAWKPDSQMMVTAQNEAIWASQQLSRAKTVATLLDSLISDAKAKLAALTPDSLTLAAAIEQVVQVELARHEQKVIVQTDQAKEERSKKVVEAEVTRLREETKAQIKQMQVEMELQREKAEAEIEKLKAAAEQEKRLRKEQARIAEEKLKSKLDEMQAAHKQEILRLRSEQNIAEARAKVEAQQNDAEARRIVLREKASDPKVKAVLKPFTTPGYWRPQGGNSPTRLPMSYKDLEAYGALDPSTKGILQLGKILRTKSDRVRPRPNLSMNFYKKPDQYEKVQQMQNYLNDLGPVLVEMGMLEP